LEALVILAGNGGQVAGGMHWAQEDGVHLWLNEHWFPGLLQARTTIETWRREYNEELPLTSG